MARAYEEMRSVMEPLAGVPWARLIREGAVVTPALHEDEPGQSVVFVDHFPTADGRATLVPTTYRPGVEHMDGEYPFVLTTGRVLEHWHTGAMTRHASMLDAIAPEALVSLHPADALSLGVRDGQMVQLATHHGVGAGARIHQRRGAAGSGVPAVRVLGSRGQQAHRRRAGPGGTHPGLQGHGRQGQRSGLSSGRPFSTPFGDRGDVLAAVLALVPAHPLDTRDYFVAQPPGAGIMRDGQSARELAPGLGRVAIPDSPLHPMPAALSSARERLDLPAVAALLLCCALWGLNQVAIKAALPEVPALIQLSIRTVLACALLLGWMQWRGVGWSLRDGTLWPGLLAGVLFAVEFGLHLHRPAVHDRRAVGRVHQHVAVHRGLDAGLAAARRAPAAAADGRPGDCVRRRGLRLLRACAAGEPLALARRLADHRGCGAVGPDDGDDPPECAALSAGREDPCLPTAGGCVCCRRWPPGCKAVRGPGAGAAWRWLRCSTRR